MPNVLDRVAGSSHRCGRSTVLRPLAREWRVTRERPAGLMHEDGVDLPKAAGEGNRCPETPWIGHKSLERIRRSVAAGDYLTPGKINVTVDCIYQELLGH